MENAMEDVAIAMALPSAYYTVLGKKTAKDVVEQASASINGNVECARNVKMKALEVLLCVHMIERKVSAKSVSNNNKNYNCNK